MKVEIFLGESFTVSNGFVLARAAFRNGVFCFCLYWKLCSSGIPTLSRLHVVGMPEREGDPLSNKPDDPGHSLPKVSFSSRPVKSGSKWLLYPSFRYQNLRKKTSRWRIVKGKIHATDGKGEFGTQTPPGTFKNRRNCMQKPLVSR